jgi:hypothetical protein
MMPRSQAGQDLFAFTVTGKLKAGTFLDVGCNDPFLFNNSAMLEECGWRGLLIDRSDFQSAMLSRKSPFLQADALTVDWSAALAAHGLDTARIDYLSFDLDDDSVSALARLPWTAVRFSCMTVEHDRYRLGDGPRASMRELLLGHGYRLLCPDAVLDGFGAFEDWWVDPSIVSANPLANRFATDEPTRWQDILAKGDT